MPKKIIINGAQGKMGTVAVQTLKKQTDFEVVAELGRHDSLSKSIDTLKPDLILDLTNAEAIHQNMQIILNSKIPSVIGTTGLSIEEIIAYKKQADDQKQGIILAPNFSIGVLLMMKYAEDAARYFNEVEIIEMHHPQKLDAPSGTARKTAQMIAKNLKPASEPSSAFANSSADTSSVSSSRGGQYDGNTIPIHAIRLSGKMAHQQVIFGSSGETLTLQHDTLNRECYMPGLLLACRAVTTLDCFVNGLENILWE